MDPEMGHGRFVYIVGNTIIEEIHAGLATPIPAQAGEFHGSGMLQWIFKRWVMGLPGTRYLSRPERWCT